MRPAQASAGLIVLFGAVLMAALDIAIVGPALPAIRAQFELGGRALSWVFSIYILFYVLGAPLLATLSDRAGRRTVLVACIGLFAAGSLAVAAAPSFAALLAGRAIQAFGAGGILPIASALIAETAPPERRGRMLGLIGASFGLAFLLGPLLGGLLLAWGWQWLFLINVPIAAVLIVGARRRLPVSPAAARGKLDAAGALLLSLLLSALVLGLSALDSQALPGSLLSVRVWPFLTVALVAAPLLWSVEKRASDPVLPPALLRSPRLRIALAVASAAGLVEAGMVFLPDVAVLGFGVSARAASLMMLPLVATLVIGAPAAGRLLDSVGPRPVLQAGLSLTAIGLALFAVLPFAPGSFYLAGAFVGLGLSSMVGAPLRYVVLQESGEAAKGAGQGLLSLWVSIGQLLGAGLIGGIMGSNAATLDGYRSALLAVAVVCAAALMATTALRPAAEDGAAVRAPRL